jgi:hypothetical protein
MYKLTILKVFRCWLLCGIIVMLAACNGDQPTPATSTAVPPQVDSTLTPTSPASPTSLPETPTATASLPPPAADAEPTLAPPESNCPDEPTVFPLQAIHHFWVNTPYGKWQWEANGTLPLIVDETGNVSSEPGEFITGRQFGTFQSGDNSCTFTAPASVIATVSGVCIDSLVTLDITEDWQMGTYTWQCDDDAFQFTIPPMGSANHPDLEFPLEESGFVVEIPFGGGGGTKSWQLIVDDIELVPLVP